MRRTTQNIRPLAGPAYGALGLLDETGHGFANTPGAGRKTVLGIVGSQHHDQQINGLMAAQAGYQIVQAAGTFLQRAEKQVVRPPRPSSMTKYPSPSCFCSRQVQRSDSLNRFPPSAQSIGSAQKPWVLESPKQRMCFFIGRCSFLFCFFRGSFFRKGIAVIGELLQIIRRGSRGKPPEYGGKVIAAGKPQLHSLLDATQKNLSYNASIAVVRKKSTKDEKFVHLYGKLRQRPKPDFCLWGYRRLNLLSRVL